MGLATCAAAAHLSSKPRTRLLHFEPGSSTRSLTRKLASRTTSLIADRAEQDDAVDLTARRGQGSDLAQLLVNRLASLVFALLDCAVDRTMQTCPSARVIQKVHH
jgi:hypothetical protein